MRDLPGTQRHPGLAQKRRAHGRFDSIRALRPPAIPFNPKALEADDGG
jgi:hypothetical protein